ncbi:MAG TPA: hypothetical protein PLA43_09090 [Bryobacteraceae bacterium]|nr:hypothetical protein [Bryobacteraceae bacterium]HOQ44890.1 hypothetical protein [Bryobacteraceae bacterium]HPQ14949.1 hypothetical protein [Bryobacteraceae bacterium]HPU72100.1 hypothetical protein [Bryobacteraceae bacterium]
MAIVIRRIAWSLALAASAVMNQAPAQELQPIEPTPQGFRIHSFSLTGGYASSGLIAPLSSVVTTNAPEYYGSAILSVGYTRTRNSRNTSLLYDAEYLRRFRISNLDAFVHRLRFITSGDLRPRWSGYFRVWASDSHIDQLLLTPTGFEFSTDPMLPDEGIAGGQAAAASNAVIFGDRVFNASIGTGLAFQKTERTRLGFHLGGDRTQGLRSEAPEPIGRLPLMPQSTVASARFEIEHAASPRTDLAFRATTFRTFSRLSAVYLSDLTLSAERRLSPNWFGNLSGGASMLKPVRMADPSRNRQTYGYNALVGLGRRTRTSTVFASAARRLGDTFGFGGHYSDSVSLTASWHHPNRRWGAIASGYAFRTRIPDARDLTGWQGTGSLVRNLGNHLAVTLTYGYLKSAMAITGDSRYIQGHTAQITLSWLPLGVARRMN